MTVDELAVDPAAPAPRRRILVAHGSDPITTAAHVVRALRRRHDVLSFGPTIASARLKAWGLEALADRVEPTDLGHATRRPAEALALRAPGWHPDLYLWIETGQPCAAEGTRELGCPTACYLIDTHIDPARHLKLARGFDHVFLAQRAHVERFRAQGHAARWLPLACDPKVHGERPVARLNPISFAGTLTCHRRVALLARLAARFPVAHRRCFLEEMAELYARSLIVFNCAVGGDLNMRVFEAMAAGALLLTDPAPGSGLEELFRDGQHCAIYQRDEELEEVAHRWLANRPRREAVAKEGQREVLAWHTYAHRVAHLERIVFDGV